MTIGQAGKRIALGLLCGGVWAAVAAAQFGGAPTKAPATLLGSVQAIVPGEPFDVALHFKCAKGWHIYWKNPGDSGRAPQVKWTLPPGFTIEPLRYPVPKEYTAAGITTYILEGEPILVARVTPPAVISEKKITIGARLVVLACAETCVPERDTLALSLTVASPGSEAKPAHADLFAKAERAFPKSSSKYVKVTPKVVADGFAAGAPFEVQLEIKIARGNHLQSNKPLQPAFIATRIFMEPTPGVLLGEPVYPKAKLREVQYVGKVAEFGGTITVTVSGKVDDEPLELPARFAGIMTFQACNDRGTCYPPQTIEFATTVNAPAAAVPAPDEEAQSQAAIEATPDAHQDAPSAPEDVIAPAPSTDEAVHADDVAEDADDTAPATTDADASTKSAAATEGGLEAYLSGLGLPGLLFGCFIYGLFINATPCVLPLLSIKVLGFVQQSHESRGRTLMLGLSFGLGVMIFFVLLGFLAASGQNILQFPIAVIALGAIVMALALNMLGVYTLQAPDAASKLDAKIGQEGVIASFGKGALAPVLGFACTGPLMAGMFGFAAQQPPKVAIAAFLVTGLGMASPYVLLGANPNWLSFLPKPGQWMITFERVMGFLLLGMVIWLVHPLITLIGAEGLEWTFVFYVAVALACWLLGRVQVSMPSGKRWSLRGGAAGLVVASWLIVFGLIYPLSSASGGHSYANSDDWSEGIPWRPWSIEEASRAGKTVFVDFTAAWCTVCKQNKGRAIHTPEVLARMEEYGIVPMQGDFTARDPTIAAMLKKYNRAGVPLNLIFPAGRPHDPIVLTPNLTKQYLLDKLEEAGPSRDANVLAASG